MKKRSKILTDLDPIERLKIQQRQSEADVTSMIKLPYAGGKPDKEKDYQGFSPNYKGVVPSSPGTRDRMPGASGYSVTTPNPIEYLMDLLKIKKFKPKRIELKPKNRPNPMPGII